MENKPTIPQKFMVKELAFFEKNVEKAYLKVKKNLFSQIGKGSRVLEIGPGNGVNFKYYPKGLKLTVVEPNVLLHEPLRKNAIKNKIKLNIIKSTSERLPFNDNSFDFVVSTLVLCSVHDLSKSLSEIRRVLRKGGKYLFIEHVLDNKSWFRRGIQHVLAHSPWMFFGDNCHPNRKTGGLILKSGFSNVRVKRYYQEGLGFFGWWIKSHIIGEAVK